MNKENELGVTLKELTDEARDCRLCEAHLPLGPRPVFQVHQDARILIAAQAPGTRVHETGLPFNDPSGDRLRDWLGVDRDRFYDPTIFAILPMGFCYPGRGKSGDLPPRPECAPAWRQQFLSALPNLELSLIIGTYAQGWHYGGDQFKNLTERVKAWREFAPTAFPLPHPSPRNTYWLQSNPWFANDLIPALRNQVSRIVAASSD